MTRSRSAGLSAASAASAMAGAGFISRAGFQDDRAGCRAHFLHLLSHQGYMSRRADNERASEQILVGTALQGKLKHA